MKRQIGIAVSAMILATQLGSPLGAAEPTTDQLRQIASLLSENDVMGLRVYLRGNPELLIEDSALSGLLRDFMNEPVAQPRLGIDPSLRSAIGRLSSQNSDSSDSDPVGGASSLY